jgi:hypothetical protein
LLEKNELKAEELTHNWMEKWNSRMNQNQLINQDDESFVVGAGGGTNDEISEISSSQLMPANSQQLGKQSLRHKRLSSGFMVQLELPYLVSLNSDKLSSDIMIYSIKPCETLLGNNENLAEIGMLINRKILKKNNSQIIQILMTYGF